MAHRGKPLACILAAIGLLAFILRVWPLYRFAVWGSDSGEYLLLTRHLVGFGALYSGEGYLGFGFAYPYFQGFEVWAGVLAAVTGGEVAPSLWLAGPLTGWLAAPLAGLLALHLLNGNRLAAIVAAAVVAAALPHVAATSHPMPGTPGQTLALAVLLLHLKALERPRWYLPLAPLLATLLITHHFSLYFYLLGAGGAWLVHCLTLPPAQRRAPTGRGAVWFSGVALVAAWYWLVYAAPFGERVLAIQPGPVGLLVAGPLAGLVLLAALLLRWPGQLKLRPKLSSPRAAGLKLVVFALAALAVVAAAALRGLPGTGIQLPLGVGVYVLPLVGLLALCAFPGLLPLWPRGPLLLGWLALPLASFAVAAASGSHELISYRHVPYLLEPLAVLAGAGAVWLLEVLKAHWQPPSYPEPGITGGLPTPSEVFLVATLRNTGPRSVLAMALGGLTLAAALTAYPPPELFGGFQEGTSQMELDLVVWARTGISGPRDPGGALAAPAATAAPASAPAAIAAATAAKGAGPRLVTDHRLSSLLFGLAGATPTWDLAGGLLHTPDLGLAPPGTNSSSGLGGGPGGSPASGPNTSGQDLDPGRLGRLWVQTPEAGSGPAGYVVLSGEVRDHAALEQWEVAEGLSGPAQAKFERAPFWRIFDNGEAQVYLVDYGLVG